MLHEIDAIVRRSGLEEIRQRAQLSAVRAALYMQVGAVVLLFFSLMLALLSLIMGGAWGLAAAAALPLLAILAIVRGLQTLAGRHDYAIYLHEARELIQQHRLIALVLDENYWQQIGEQLSLRLPFALGGRSLYRNFPDHLSFCACHYRSLAEIAEGSAKLNPARVWIDQTVYQLQPVYSLPTVTMVVSIVLCAVAVFMLWPLMLFIKVFGILMALLIGLLYFALALSVFTGRDYIASRAALVVFCDMLLDDR